MTLLKSLGEKLIVPLVLGTAISGCVTADYYVTPKRPLIIYDSPPPRSSDWLLEEKEDFGKIITKILGKERCDFPYYFLAEIKKDENDHFLLNYRKHDVIGSKDLLVRCSEKDSKNHYWQIFEINLDQLRREFEECQWSLSRPCPPPAPELSSPITLERITAQELSKVVQIYVSGPKNNYGEMK